MLNKIKDVLNKKKGKVIRDVEHIGDIPKPQGRLLHFVEECPLWGMIVALFVFIAIEMLGFAWLYSVISASSFLDSFDYSLFSVLGETAAESVQNSLRINRLISVQSIITNCVISFFMAIVLYKLINIKPKLIKVEDHLVFDPTTGILRLRIANTSKFSLTNVHIDAIYRIYLPESNRHASAKLQLKFDNIYIMDSYSVWNIATKPFLPKHGDCPQLDKTRYDNERVYEFIPDMLNEEYRSVDSEEAKRLEYNNLNVIISVKSPLFSANWVYRYLFTPKDFFCGKLDVMEKLAPHTIDWSSWGQYKDMSEIYCDKCAFADHCSIIKKEHTTIN